MSLTFRELDWKDQLVLCGPFMDHEGGMVIVRADSLEAARMIAKSDLFVTSGVESYEIRTLHLSNEENDDLGVG